MGTFFLYDVFKPSCERLGIKLLADDLRFIGRYLSKVPSDKHKSILKQYQKEWLNGMEGHFFLIQRMNRGRKKANEFLRDICGDN